jgi:hypothetical protein
LFFLLIFVVAGLPVQADVWDQLTLDDVYGIYQVSPASSGWHTGAIRASETRVVWANAAGVYWNLQPDLTNGRLLIGPDCPYYVAGQDNNFDIVLETDGFGDPIPVVSGFNFNGSFHPLTSTGSPLDFILQSSVPGLSNHYIDSITTYLQAKSDYEGGLYTQAQATLDALWAQYPVGDSVWWSIFGETPFGLNLGTPPAYYGLRQLSDMTAWRLANPGHAGAARTIRLSVIMVGKSNGIEPKTQLQLETGGGTPVTHDLDPRIPVNNYAVVHESLELFKEYIHTISLGVLEIDAQIIDLPNLDVAVSASTSNGANFAGMSNYTEPFGGVSAAEIEATDWWWIVYPAHIPEQFPDFQYTAFIAGGMGRGPNGGPAFISDDRWLVRVPGHLGLGTYEPNERKTYLPQWLQHEVFHHFYQVWNEFGLEDQPHQWFNQATWPADFVGQFEPDYYHESVFKRLQGAQLPLHVGLRYATADAPWDTLALDDVLGNYERNPVENPWHAGDILLDGSPLRWLNNAGVSWSLTPDLPSGALQIGSDCPYYDPNVNNDFRLALKREPQFGDLTTELEGFSFLGELYEKQVCVGEIPSITFPDKLSFAWDGVAFPFPVYVQGEGRAEITTRSPSIVATPATTSSAGRHSVAASNPTTNDLYWWLVRTPGNDALCNITWSSGGVGETGGRDVGLP